MNTHSVTVQLNKVVTARLGELALLLGIKKPNPNSQAHAVEVIRRALAFYDATLETDAAVLQSERQRSRTGYENLLFEPTEPFFQTLALSLLAIVVGGAVRGLVLSRMWTWFVHDVFSGVPSLDVLPAIGLWVLLREIVGGRESDEEMSSQQRLFRGLRSVFFSSGFTLLIGWIVHWLMLHQG